MKKIFLSLTIVLGVVLTGCLDTVEEITITANGSGTHKTTMDMSRMFDMLQMIAAMDTSSDKKIPNFTDKDFDTTIQMRGFADTASDLTAEQKQIFKRPRYTSLSNKQKRNLNWPCIFLLQNQSS